MKLSEPDDTYCFGDGESRVRQHTKILEKTAFLWYILMMNKRLVKQIIYGIFYLAVFSLLIFLIYFIWFKPIPTCFDNRQNQGEKGIDCGGSCKSCEINTLIIEKNWIKYFPAENKTIIAAEIKNSNSNFGADSFLYALDIFGKNNEKIKTLSGKSLIYASDIEYIIEFAEINSKDIGKIEISFSEISWKKTEEFLKPRVQNRELETKTEDKTVAVSGIITNNNPFPLSKIKIAAFLISPSNIFISASKTELEDIVAYGEKSFKIIFPKNVSLISAASQQSLFNLNLADPNKTKIYVESIR